jgi:release factor glutamine methyltransferase
MPKQDSSSPLEPPWTILKILQWATPYFQSHDIDSPRLTAEVLLAHVLGVERIDLYARFDQPLSPEELSHLKSLIRRRIDREPTAYIIGRKEFMGFDLSVTPAVLIPRPETEMLVEAALEILPEASRSDPCRVIDIGTGSGAVIIALARMRPGHCFSATDISPAAVELARTNAAAMDIDSIEFSTGDLFIPAAMPSETYDLVVSNPPYIPTGAICELAPEIKCFEPVAALDGGPDGLNIIRRIISLLPEFLSPKGRLMMEIGWDQADAVSRLAVDTETLEGVTFIRDYAGHDRVAVMQRKI